MNPLKSQISNLRWQIALLALFASPALAQPRQPTTSESSIFATEAPTAPPPAPAIPQGPTRFAQRDFTIKFGGRFKVRSDDVQTIISREAKRLAPEVLGIPADDVPAPSNGLFGGGGGGGMNGGGSIQVLLLSEEDRLQKFQIFVDVSNRPSAKLAAGPFLDRLMEAIENALRADISRQRSDAIEPLQRDVAETKTRVANAEGQASQLRATLRDLAGRADISSNTITGTLGKLEEERQKLELDMLGKGARREALEKAIAEQSDRAEKKALDDPIAAELAKAVAVREDKVKFVTQQVEKGVATMAEQRDAVAAAAEARAKLLERKREAMAEAGGGMLDAMNKELLVLAIDLKELNARLDFVKKQLPGLRDAMDQLDALQRAEGELQSARNESEETAHKLRELSRELDAGRPVTVDITNSVNLAKLPPPTTEPQGH
jgi:predicted  nucleic acid-binding Zn-ribbon protein